MSYTLIDGNRMAGEIRSELRDEVQKRIEAGRVRPHLTVVLVGDNPASASYVRAKAKAAEDVGMSAKTLRYPATITQEELLNVLVGLNHNPAVHGILVQLPLPTHIDERVVIETIVPEKDVDGFHPVNVGRVSLDQGGFAPCTPAGIVEMLKRTGIKTSGAHAVIIGRSNIVGRPMANLLLHKGLDATVTVCHSRTRNLPELARQADILVAAIGRAHFVTADMVRPGAVVIDVGINRIEDPSRERGYRLVGDVDFDAVAPISSAITPVPGGVGPMTIAMLLQNTVRAAP